MNPNLALVIDDEPEIREFIGDVAEENGFEVATAESFDQFRTGYGSLEPTLIVLDLQMPDVDGVELLRYLAEEDCGAQILLISGMDQKILHTTQRLGVSQGLKMLGALQKPIMLAELEGVLQRVRRESLAITEDDLREAIEAEDLVLYYQPKVKVGSERAWDVDAIEALVRWQHPDRGMLPPDRFIPLAESSGLIGGLTDFVLGAALAQVRRWQDDGLTLTVAINFPPQLLTDLTFPDRLANQLRECGVDASQVILEITESGAMADTASTMDILTRLRLKGVRLSMDDFGTGYSSLVELYRMPFSELKIDKSFVMGVGEDDEAETIVRSVVALGHNLGLEVCAEGVETEAAMDLLRDVHCEKAQGYYISKPIPVEEMTQWLRACAPESILPDLGMARHE